MDKTKEGYVLFSKITEKYIDNNQYEVEDFREVEIYNTKQEAQDEFKHMDVPDEFIIQHIKLHIEVIKEFVRKVTFEEVS